MREGCAPGGPGRRRHGRGFRGGGGPARLGVWGGGRNDRNPKCLTARAARPPGRGTRPNPQFRRSSFVVPPKSARDAGEDAVEVLGGPPQRGDGDALVVAVHPQLVLVGERARQKGVGGGGGGGA